MRRYCGNMNLYYCGNFQCHETVPAENFKLFSCLDLDMDVHNPEAQVNSKEFTDK